jgi:5-methylcytosine-specific restriction endonuclease McrA
VRTPNTQCLLCGKPLYRRPADMAKHRYAACMACRSEAQKQSGITEKQYAGLSLGREKGTNHRTGYRHREESKRKVAEKNRAFWAAHPEKAYERGAKNRGENNYKWKGGITKLNKAIRQMRQNRKWMDAIKARDGCCIRCGSTDKLESHHTPELSVLIAHFNIKSCEDARTHAESLWSLDNGITLCEPCHYTEHGRRRAA